MRSERGRRGVTVLELLGASAIATIVGGSMLLLLTGMRDVYQTHTTFTQLSGYLDGATAVLRQDIWRASSATGTAGDGLCSSGNSSWLQLTNGTITDDYCLDNTTDPNNVTLQRRENGGPAWNVAHFVVQGVTTRATKDSPLAGLITIKLQVKRTVNGRGYVRQINGVVYRMQAQP